MNFIKYRGQQLPITFDYWVIKREAIRQGVTTLKSLSDIDMDRFESLNSLCFLGLQRGHKLEEKEFTITVDDIDDILSVAIDQFYLVLGECIPNVFSPSQLSTESGKTDDSKKN